MAKGIRLNKKSTQKTKRSGREGKRDYKQRIEGKERRGGAKRDYKEKIGLSGFHVCF